MSDQAFIQGQAAKIQATKQGRLLYKSGQVTRGYFTFFTCHNASRNFVEYIVNKNPAMYIIGA